jgi:hypothetical protein
MFQVLLGSERQERIGRIRSRLGERFAVAFDVQELVHLLAGDLLFVERAQDQQRRAGVLQRSRGVRIVGERPGAHDQRMGQADPEIRRREIHHFSFVSGLGAASESVC